MVLTENLMETPAIAGPETYDRNRPSLTFQISTGWNRFFAVEVAKDWALLQRAAHEADRTDNNFYASWRQGFQEAGRETTYTLPTDAWNALRDAQYLYYRVLTSADQGPGWTNFQASTGDEVANSAPRIELTGPFRRDPVLPFRADEVHWRAPASGAVRPRDVVDGGDGGAPNLQFMITVGSPDSGMVGDVAIHGIEFDGPTMPALTILAPLNGLSDADDAAQERQIRLEVTYRGGNRNDTVYVPAPIEGVDAAWQSVTGPQWQPGFDGFCGGDLTVYCQAIVNGQLIQGRSAQGGLVIWGKNPPKADIRDALGGASNICAVGYEESVFTQFSATNGKRSLIPYRVGPATVLRAPDNGFGIGQLTFPRPTIVQLWNWRENVGDMLDRLRAARAAAAGMQQRVQGQHPDAGVPDLTDDQLDLEMWARYNGGINNRYHVYDDASNAWQRRAVGGPNDTSLGYADRVMGWRNQVDANNPPPGWD